MKNPFEIIVKPHITEKAVTQSYGDERSARVRMLNDLKKAGTVTKGGLNVPEEELVRKYTFIVATDANKLEIKAAIEAIYNEGKKDDQKITVASVRTLRVLGKKRRRGSRTGYQPDRKKAIITLAKGQLLEDYGV